MRLNNTFTDGQVAPIEIPLAFQAHAEDGALTIPDSESLLRACSWLAGGDTTHPAQLMEVTVYNSRGYMKTHHRGICYRTKLRTLNANKTDRIVLWDSTTSSIMSHGPVVSARVSLRVDAPPGGTAEPTMHTMGTFPLPVGCTLDAHMHNELHDGIRTWCNKRFGTMRIQHSAAMPPGSHILRIAVKRVYDRTRTWVYEQAWRLLEERYRQA
jgi:hypothetical protein